MRRGSDISFLDEYLVAWDRFAQGDSSLVEFLREKRERFEQELAELIWSGDKRAAGRLVFYTVVQVGGGIPCDSDLGKACEELLGADFPRLSPEKGGKVYFAGDLFFWWEANKQSYGPFELFDDWCRREFANETVIPMYKSGRGGLQGK